MRPSNSIFSPLLAVLSCLACGSACLASPAGHNAPSKHPHKSSHAAPSHKSPVAPIAIQSVPLPVELAGHGSFIMAMCTDHTGRLWLGTEEQGIFSYDQRQPYKSRWRHWTTADGLGDNTCYCLCVDSKNRVFAGSNNSGCSVFNGTSGWRSYSQLTGPLGAHLYAMAVSPVTGSVFMATEAGIAVYNEKGDVWSYLLAPQGRSLPTATSLAFNKAGDLILGSQTGGIYIGRAASSFQHWDHVPGPEYMPRSASGPGLPSGDINCLLTARGGNVIWCGTRCGVGISLDGGSHWGFVRGADFADKVNGLYSTRAYDSTVSGLELMSVEQYQKFIAPPVAAKSPAISIPPTSTPPTGAQKPNTISSSWIALDAADAPADQLGVHISVDGGTPSKREILVDTSKVTHPAAASLYGDERQGNFTYTFSGLPVRQTLMLRLHCSELDFTGIGQRQFLVIANGSPAMPPMDIFDRAQGIDTAVVQDVPVKTDAYGMLRLSFMGLRPEVYEPPAPAPAAGQMLSQDYVTCLSQGNDGKVYIGHWETGLECYNPETQSFEPEPQTAAPGGSAAGFVTSLLPLRGGGVLIGGYGNGLSYADVTNATFQQRPPGASFSGLRSVDAPYPSSAKPPTAQKLREIASELTKSGQPNMKPGEGAFLSSDWSTEGAWLGRYGQKYTLMCAADSPLNSYFITDFDYSADGDLGPNRQPSDYIRRWIQWLKSADERVMYDPIIGTGRESEFDDHGESYNRNTEGPDLWITVSVPAGVHRLSAYFMNKDGQTDSNKCRDYDLVLLPYRTDERASAFLKPLAVGRVRQFWHGVYQSFAVCGPAKYYLKIGRSNSFNTIVSAILLDKIYGPPTQWEEVSLPCIYLAAPEYQSFITLPASQAVFDATWSVKLPVKLWSALTSSCGNTGWCSAVVPARILCYRALLASVRDGSATVGTFTPLPAACAPWDTRLCKPVPITVNNVLTYWRRSLPFTTTADKEAYNDAITRAWKDELVLCPSLNRNDL